MSDVKRFMEKTTRLGNRSRIAFLNCPDCGWSDYPRLNRSNLYYEEVCNGDVSAQCKICGWETPQFSTVRECAEYWNGFDFSEKQATSGYITTKENVSVYNAPCTIVTTTASMEEENESD